MILVYFVFFFVFVWLLIILGYEKCYLESSNGIESEYV